MGPKKRAGRTPTKPQSSSRRTSGKRVKKGLLGVASGYNSESDQDYDPLAGSKKRSTPKARHLHSADDALLNNGSCSHVSVLP